MIVVQEMAQSPDCGQDLVYEWGLVDAQGGVSDILPSIFTVDNDLQVTVKVDGEDAIEKVGEYKLQLKASVP